MTTMDSDSESQDSDEGRRFRFEATRKDPVAPVNTANEINSPKKKFKHKSRSESRKYDRDSKERSKYENYRKIDDKDVKYLKYSKHDAKRSRQEDDKIVRKDYRDIRDTSAGSAMYDRNSKNSSEIKEKTWESKRQSDRDREHSYERNYDQRESNDKHRSRHCEKHRYHSRDRSRDRSYQSNKVKSSDIDRSRDDRTKYDSSRKLVKENKSQDFENNPSVKKIKRTRNSSEARSISSNESVKKDTSIDIHDCKDIDLSQFDVLSEINETISDCADSRSQIELKKHSKDQHKKEKVKQERKEREKRHKVKTRNNDPMSGPSNNNPSAISDSSRISPTTISVMKKIPKDSESEKSEYCQEDKLHTYDSNESLHFGEKYSRHHSTDISSDEELDNSDCKKRKIKSSSTADNGHHEVPKKIDCEKVRFIGPCLPQSDETKSTNSNKSDQLNSHQNEEQESNHETSECSINDGSFSLEQDVAFGPALPPHLLEHKHHSDSQSRIIGPVLPSIAKQHKEDPEMSTASDDDCTIGPLPADHPALRNSRVHMQLDVRAQKMKEEGYVEENDITSKREEWMTELPPAHIANLGLGPRKFRLKSRPDMSDRSCWTDTPTQKAQKQKDLETKKFSNIQKLDGESTKNVDNKKVDKDKKQRRSLLEMHQSKLKKKKKKEEKEAKLSGKSTRRPFDRDIDLQVNRFDQAQKKNILTKAQLLDDRFSRGEI